VGAGNVLYGDDGFGVEVARRLAAGPVPERTRVLDIGIRGIQLLFELLDPEGPPDLLIIADAVSHGKPPGTVSVLAPDLDAGELTPDPDREGAHGMDPAAVLARVRALGGELPQVRLVACEPADVYEHIGLSPPVRDAVEPALATVRALIERELSAPEPRR
jgi:hydrogenase maturation protease